MAGLPNHSSEDLQHLYDKGDVHGYFDAAALHPYTAEKHGVLTLARRFRKVMERNGDGGRQLWITELGLPASKGKSTDKSKLQTDDQGMAKFLSQSYRDLAANRHELRVPKVYWYTWASPYHGWIFNYTGLRLYTHDGGHVKQSNMPAFAVYRKLALHAEGR